MAVTALRRHLMPGFTELAADMVLADVLGTEAYGALLRLCLVAEPAADLPGSWVICHTQAELAAYLGFSANKTQRLLAVLTDADALVRERGIRLGRGMGATPDRYFVAAVPGLITPPAPGPRGPVTPLPHTVAVNAVVKASAVQDRGAQGPVPSRNAGYAPTGSADVSELSDDYSSDAVEPEPSTSGLLAASLSRIGWTGPMPAVSDTALVAAVASWLAGQTGIANKAAYLHTLIGKGDVERFAAERGIARPASGESATGLTSAEFVQLKRAFPDWADQVTLAAQQVAVERGCAVRLALLCEVAASIPTPDRTTGQMTREAQ